MAHLWIEETNEWAVAPLDGDRFALTARKDKPVKRVKSVADILLMHARKLRDEGWLLLTAADRNVRVNGARVLGLHRLRDRDEIRVPRGGRFFFTTERLAQIEPFPGADREILCPRCKKPIEKGEPAVRCPTCDLWHHQGETSCWTFADRCAGCDHPTELPATFRWSPAGL
jgi:hypothetical protein